MNILSKSSKICTYTFLLQLGLNYNSAAVFYKGASPKIDLGEKPV